MYVKIRQNHSAWLPTSNISVALDS